MFSVCSCTFLCPSVIKNFGKSVTRIIIRYIYRLGNLFNLNENVCFVLCIKEGELIYLLMGGGGRGIDLANTVTGIADGSEANGKQ